MSTISTQCNILISRGVDLAETQMLLGRVKLCDKDQDLLVVMKRELSILCTKCHFERHFFYFTQISKMFCVPLHQVYEVNTQCLGSVCLFHVQHYLLDFSENRYKVCEFIFGAWPNGHNITHHIKYKSC